MLANEVTVMARSLFTLSILLACAISAGAQDSAMTQSMPALTDEECWASVHRQGPTDPLLFSRAALGCREWDDRKAAVDKITDQGALLKLTMNKKAQPELRHYAATKLKGKAVDFRGLAGDTRTETSDAAEAIARINLAFEDPIVTARIPYGAYALDVNFGLKAQGYGYPDRPWCYTPGLSGCAELIGEDLTFRIKQGPQTVAAARWRTKFPDSAVVNSSEFVSAELNVSGLLQKFFSLPGFTQDDLVKLSQSEVPEIRAGATGNLDDQILLKRILSREKVLGIRYMAVTRLTDQAVLTGVSVNIQENPNVRVAAIRRLTDQAVLAELMAHGDEKIRTAASVRLIELGEEYWAEHP
jgi:hypothetical protein